jgi:hypothetical protein
MWPKFWKASLISLLAYTAAILVAVWVGLWMVLFVPGIQLVWTAVCIIRVIQLRRDREGYGFYLGSLISSCVLLFGIVVWSQMLARVPR